VLPDIQREKTIRCADEQAEAGLKCPELSELFSFTKHFLRDILSLQENPWYDFTREAVHPAHEFPETGRLP